MKTQPDQWSGYYSGTNQEVELLKVFSYSDRIRYYWNDQKVAAALKQLLASLGSVQLPETVISQTFMGLEFGSMSKDPKDLIKGHVQRCVGRYFEAAGLSENYSVL